MLRQQVSLLILFHIVLTCLGPCTRPPKVLAALTGSKMSLREQRYLGMFILMLMILFLTFVARTVLQDSAHRFTGSDRETRYIGMLLL